MVIHKAQKLSSHRIGLLDLRGKFFSKYRVEEWDFGNSVGFNKSSLVGVSGKEYFSVVVMKITYCLCHQN